MDKPSLKALRRLALSSGWPTDHEVTMLHNALPALLAIAEAAQALIHGTDHNDSVGDALAAVDALRAALAMMEE